jgi:hypothetical protein
MEEFDDIVVTGGCYVNSKKAVQAMRDVAKQHGLSFTFNPGGGEFYNDTGFRCQISTYADIEDLKKLRETVAQQQKKTPSTIRVVFTNHKPSV